MALGSRPELDFLRKTGPYSIIDDSFPVTCDFYPIRTQVLPTKRGKSLPRNASLWASQVRSKVFLATPQVTPRTSVSRKPAQEYTSPGIINVADFVSSAGHNTHTSALRPSPLRQPPKLRQFLHRELLRKRQLSLDEASCKRLLEEKTEPRPTALLLGQRKERNFFSPERSRLKRGLACSSRRRPKDYEGLQTLGTALDPASKDRPQTSNRSYRRTVERKHSRT